MKIRFYLVFVFASIIIAPFSGNIFAQTYTTSGLSDNWIDPIAWIKTNPEACVTPNPANTPPLGPVYSTCDIRIIINHPIVRPGNANIGGGNVRSITVNQGGEIEFGGNLTVNNVGAPTFLFQINDGGRFIVGGTLGIRSGATFNLVNTYNLNPKSYVRVNRLTFLNSGSGQSVNVGENTIFIVEDRTRLEGGGSLNIQGQFITDNLNSTNSGGSSINVSGNGTMNVNGNMDINGFPLNLSDNASAVVGGNLNITNSGTSAVNLGANTNLITLTPGNNIAAGKTPSGAGCYQTPENGNSCTSLACLTIEEMQTGVETIERIFIFRCNTNWQIPGPTSDEEPVDLAEILIVAGGGGGGRGTSAGGGGAGGLIYIPTESIPFGTTVPVIIGNGGTGSTNTNSRGSNGSNSRFLTNEAIGGGGGGSNNNAVRNGANGGSGGGGSRNGANGTGGLREEGQGNNGANAGTGNPGRQFGAGGGGAGSGGTTNSGNNQAGTGGEGFNSDISNINEIYSAGGGGTMTGPGNSSRSGVGGSGVGGNGNNSGNGGNGSTPGSGGGAGSSRGGNGANGIVIIRQSFKILPVEFLDINATFSQEIRTSQITWATAKEWENSHFEVERSIDNVTSFEKIGEVEGVGYSDDRSDYIYNDEELPLIGSMAYYRIKQVDFSGSYAYSKTVGVNIPQIQISRGTWRAYPNPTTGEQLKIALVDRGQYAEEQIIFRIIHPSLVTQSISVRSEREMNDSLSQLISRVPKGVFVVEIQWGQKVEHIKILKK